MNAEIISIGTELLLGQIVDTNAAWLAQQLAAAGVNLYRKQTVGDNRARVASVLREALERADLVITTGGLGPTVDDVTREAIADAAGVTLSRDPALVEVIESFFARWGRKAGTNNLRQADLPDGARPLDNPVGTAPGILLELPGGKTIIAVPGVPHEMKRMISDHVIPYLRERGVSAVIKVRVLRTAAIGESMIDEKIADLELLENPTVGLAAHMGRVDIRIAARAATEAEANTLIEHVAGQVRKRLDEWIFGEDDDTLESVVASLLKKRQEAVAVYEGTEAGFLADALAGAGVPVVASESGSVATLPGDEQAKIRAQTFAAENCAAWGLALYTGEVGVDGAASAEEHAESIVAVAGRQQSRVRRLPRAGDDERERGWLLSASLDLLRRELLRDDRAA
jgi:nicotinamide-nucleotide amidase